MRTKKVARQRRALQVSMSFAGVLLTNESNPVLPSDTRAITM